MLRSTLAIAALAVLVITLVPATRGEDDQVPAKRMRVVEDRSNDVYEARFLLITPDPKSDATGGLDLRLRHVLGDRATDPNARFFVVSQRDPEMAVANLRALGDVRILDRCNLPLDGKGSARYRRGFRLPVPQVECRDSAAGESSLVRTKFEDLGTKVTVKSDGSIAELSLEASFALAFRKPIDYPIVATASWDARLSMLPGQTAVFRTQFRLPPEMLSPFGGEPMDAKSGTDRKPADLVKMLVVLLTRSSL